MKQLVLHYAMAFAMMIGVCGCRDQSSQNTPTYAKIVASPPQRVISLDFCADQYVLQFVDRENILAVSPDAEAAFSYLREKAQGIKTVRPTAEDALILKPDLIVRSYGGGANAAQFFEKAGVRVVNVGWANDFEAIKKVTRTMAHELGASARGEVLIKDLEKRLDVLQKQRNNNPLADNRTLYMTPTGTTTGAGSLIHEMLVLAGLENYQEKAGWRSLPLERLVYEKPDMIAAGFFDSNANQAGGWSAMRHPIARQQMNAIPFVSLKGSWLSCGAWFAIDSVEALARERDAVLKRSTETSANINLQSINLQSVNIPSVNLQNGGD